MKEKLKQLSEYEWQLPKEGSMNVNGLLIGNKAIMTGFEDDTIGQVSNVTQMPGVIDPVIALPDAHFGYGLPMGSVAAFDAEKGVISSGLCGFDINCGVNLIRTSLAASEVQEKLKELIPALFSAVPCGVGSKGKLRVDAGELKDVLTRGVNWAVENGYGTKEDIEHLEERGCMEGADPTKVSELAMKRGCPQLGTLGAGNHFLEIQKVSDIYDNEFAKKHGIDEEGQVTILLHCGSRGFGHQVASDYLKIQEKAVRKYSIRIPDRQLVCAPADSEEGRDYFKAMKCAVNYSFTNRIVMTQWIRETFEKIFSRDWESMGMRTVYGLCHNVVKLEEHTIGGVKRKVLVHRKGATRAFPGEVVLLAGTMGTSSYMCRGTETAMQKTFGSSCHGAGRAMSRHAAINKYFGETVKKELEQKGEFLKSTSPKILAEEAPGAYKNVDDVVASVDATGISPKVCRMVPMGVLKG